MLKFIVTSTILATLITPALAADLEPAVVVETPQAFNWNGFYAGVHGGYGWSDNKTSFIDDPQLSYNGDGGFGGGVVGYNVQFANNVVIGAEAELNWGDIKGTATDSGVDYEAKINWFGSVSARLGYAFDRFLVFGTAGGAFAGIDSSLDSQPGDYAPSSDTFAGWTVGAGAEYGITNNLTARIDYRYYDFGSKDYPVTWGTNGYYWTQHDVKVTAQTVSAGLSYKF